MTHNMPPSPALTQGGEPDLTELARYNAQDNAVQGLTLPPSRFSTPIPPQPQPQPLHQHQPSPYPEDDGQFGFGDELVHQVGYSTTSNPQLGDYSNYPVSCGELEPLQKALAPGSIGLPHQYPSPIPSSTMVNNQMMQALVPWGSPAESPPTGLRRSARNHKPEVQEVAVAEESLPKVRGRPRKRAAANGRGKVAIPMEKPLSELAKFYGVKEAPVLDVPKFVTRSVEERLLEVENGKVRGKVPRPMNAFMIYRKAYQNVAKKMSAETNHQIVSRYCGSSWAQESDSLREKFREWSAIERDNHSKAFPGYKFKPSKAPIKKLIKEEQIAAWDSDSDDEYKPAVSYRAAGTKSNKRRAVSEEATDDSPPAKRVRIAGQQEEPDLAMYQQPPPLDQSHMYLANAPYYTDATKPLPGVYGNLGSSYNYLGAHANGTIVDNHGMLRTTPSPSNSLHLGGQHHSVTDYGYQVEPQQQPQQRLMDYSVWVERMRQQQQFQPYQHQHQNQYTQHPQYTQGYQEYQQPPPIHHQPRYDSPSSYDRRIDPALLAGNSPDPSRLPGSVVGAAYGSSSPAPGAAVEGGQEPVDDEVATPELQPTTAAATGIDAVGQYSYAAGLPGLDDDSFLDPVLGRGMSPVDPELFESSEGGWHIKANEDWAGAGAAGEQLLVGGGVGGATDGAADVVDENTTVVVEKPVVEKPPGE